MPHKTHARSANASRDYRDTRTAVRILTLSASATVVMLGLVAFYWF